MADEKIEVSYLNTVFGGKYLRYAGRPFIQIIIDFFLSGPALMSLNGRRIFGRGTQTMWN